MIMPLIYRYRGRHGSDRNWIESRMHCIPGPKQKEVAEEYERIYLGDKINGRNKANTYLNDLAKEYRNNGK